jgi:hypothetical protein
MTTGAPIELPYNEDSKLLHQAEIAIMPRGHKERLWAHLVNTGRFETPDLVRFEATRQGCTSAAADTGQVTPTFQALLVLYRSICSTSLLHCHSLFRHLLPLSCPKLSHSLQPLEGSHRRPTSYISKNSHYGPNFSTIERTTQSTTKHRL